MSTVATSRFYEMMVISLPEGAPEDIQATVDAVDHAIVNAGGSVLRSSSDSPWGRRRLAYPIRHQSQDIRDGFYTLFYFEIEPQAIPDIERELKLNERLLRYMILHLEAMPIFPEPEDEAEGEPAGEEASGGDQAGEAATPVADAAATEQEAVDAPASSAEADEPSASAAGAADAAPVDEAAATSDGEVSDGEERS